MRLLKMFLEESTKNGTLDVQKWGNDFRIISRNGKPLTIKELAKKFGVNRPQVHSLVKSYAI